MWSAPSKVDLTGHLIPFETLGADRDVQEVLGEADVLITDYSSCYIDYLLCDRPILFYCHDLDRYRSERGFYFEYESVTPGPRTASVEELIRHLDAALSGKDEYVASRAQLRERFFKDPDAGSCERVYAAVQAAVEARR
ncbi:MAG: CDP-glycerol glycerophosphotransferase family protein [Candidatus Eisenbacteria bacterium]|nr:CDP-glycerol glycerophosphotransferase family protein [Candidatus Eisenbacteria bacterium]